MIIQYVEGEVTIFEVNGKIYYFRDSPNFPELFDDQLHKLIVPNLDHWIQAATDQRHSLRGLQDMSVAFLAGLHCGVSDQDAYILVNNTINATRQMIFHTDLANRYGRMYFIELIDPTKIESVHTKSIAANFDKLLEKCGRTKLYNYLCRFWQACNYTLPSVAAVFEAFIRRLGLQPTTPEYPETGDLDNELKEKVCRMVFRKMSVYHISDEMIINARRIQTRRI